MDLRLNGLNPLSYLGVNPYTPVPFIKRTFAPTVNDNQNFAIGTVWLYSNVTTMPNQWTAYMLVSLVNQVATWQPFLSGGGSITDFVTNSGTAAPAGGILNVLGVNVVTTSGSGNTVNVGLSNGSNGQVIIGGGTAPAWASITAGSNIVLSPGANSLTISATGSGGGGASVFNTDSGTATQSGGAITIHGTHNINTSGTAATVSVNGNNAITLGDLTPLSTGTGAVTAQTGDIYITAGSLWLPNTPSGGGSGQINFGGARFISDHGAGNAFIGSGSGNTSLTGSFNSGLGSGVLQNATSASNSSCLGYQAGVSLTSGSDNSLYGSSCGADLTIGQQNCGYGSQSLTSLVGGSNNVAAGYSSMALATSANDCVSIGWGTGVNLLSSSRCVLVGFATGSSYASSESNNIIIGDSAGAPAESGVIRIGSSGGATTSNTFIGDGTGNVSLTVGTAINNTVVGSGSYGLVTTGANNSIFGTTAGNHLTTGSRNTFGGVNSGGNQVASSDNTAWGYNSLVGAVSSAASQNVAIGSSCMSGSSSSATQNVAVGYACLGSATTAADNVAIGAGCLNVLTSGASNVAVGATSMAASTSAFDNVAVGPGTLNGLKTGFTNTCIGYFSGSAYTSSESNNIIVGNNSGVVGDSNVTRIGASQTGAYMAGIYNTAVGATTQSVIIDNTGKLGVDTNGVYIPITAWTPILLFGGSGTGITYARQLGFYTQSGRVVNFWVNIILTADGSSTGSATISGFPYGTTMTGLVTGTALAGSLGNITYPANFIQFTPIMNTSGLILLDYMINNSIAMQLQHTAFSNGSSVLISGTIFVP